MGRTLPAMLDTDGRVFELRGRGTDVQDRSGAVALLKQSRQRHPSVEHELMRSSNRSLFGKQILCWPYAGSRVVFALGIGCRMMGLRGRNLSMLMAHLAPSRCIASGKMAQLTSQ